MRSCYLWFHGKNGVERPRALGGVSVDTLAEAVDIMQSAPRMPAEADLAGAWCCSFAEASDAGPVHPASCQCRFSLSARGRISDLSIVQ